MKKGQYLFVFLCILYATPNLSFGQLPYHQNHQIFASHKRLPHPLLFPFETEQAAVNGEKEKSPWFQSLNGLWKFNWVKAPADRPVDFYEKDFDDSEWGTIPVPGNWEIHGYGYPIYLDEKYPFRTTYPNTPVDYNPVGSYRKTFTISENWLKRDVILHFGAVKSAIYVWVNGKKVGFSQGSKTPAEFDISSYVQAGENELALEIYRWSDASYIESQDMLRLTGIERDVYLYAQPKVYIQDVFARTERMPDQLND